MEKQKKTLLERAPILIGAVVLLAIAVPVGVAVQKKVKERAAVKALAAVEPTDQPAAEDATQQLAALKQANAATVASRTEVQQRLTALESKQSNFVTKESLTDKGFVPKDRAKELVAEVFNEQIKKFAANAEQAQGLLAAIVEALPGDVGDLYFRVGVKKEQSGTFLVTLFFRGNAKKCTVRRLQNNVHFTTTAELREVDGYSSAWQSCTVRINERTALACEPLDANDEVSQIVTSSHYWDAQKKTLRFVIDPAKGSITKLERVS